MWLIKSRTNDPIPAATAIARWLAAALSAVLAVASAGCSLSAYNYLESIGPRYGESHTSLGDSPMGKTLRVVTFNIKFAKHIDEASAALATDPVLKDADVIQLQEMDLTGTERIACALGGRSFVYYPGALHPGTGKPLRPFGVAIVSRWPIVADTKLALPLVSSGDNAAKTAAAALINVGGRLVRFVNIHLQAGLKPEEMRIQLQAAFDALDKTPLSAEANPPTVVTGDFNSFTSHHLEIIAEQMKSRELVPVFGHEVHTFTFAGLTLPVQLDHIFVSKCLAAGSTAAARGERRGSDHYPLRADLPLQPGNGSVTVGREDPPLVCPVPAPQKP